MQADYCGYVLIMIDREKTWKEFRMFGIFIALTCAFVWSVSLILLKMSSNDVPGQVLNLGKNTLGLIFLLPTAYLVEGPMPQIQDGDLIALLTSGFVGIGIADALTLLSMKHLKAGEFALLECLLAPCIITLSVIFLGETVSTKELLGALCVGLGLLLTIELNQLENKNNDKNLDKKPVLGVVLMSLGLLTMAGGILIVDPSYERVPLFWIIAIRMVAGVIGSSIVFLLFPNRKASLQQLIGSKNKALLLTGFIFSAYISISLWVAGFKYNDASIAAVLNQTSTFFTLILAAVILKEKLTTKKIIATIIATLGVILISAH